MGQSNRPWSERFWERVDATGDCWEWTGSRKANGYGVFNPPLPGGTRHVHRLAYEELVGPIPVGLVIDHLCRNRACVNPDHMEAVTQAENVRRGIAPKMARLRTVTHCLNGHPYDEENTLYSSGRRRCGICRRASVRDTARRRRARLKEGS